MPATRPTPPDYGPSWKPDFGKNVIILDSTDTGTFQERVRRLTSVSQVQTQDGSEFGNDRYAVLIKSGTYQDLFIDVGYYMTIHGLGSSPDDVQINGLVQSPGSSNPATKGLALNNFWRGVENVSITPRSRDGTGNPVNKWAVSQATFLRRFHMCQGGEFWLWDLDKNWGAGFSSGGFIADSLFDVEVNAASQQQFLTRNSTLNG